MGDRPPAAERLAAALPPRPLNIQQNGVGVDSLGFLVRYLGLDGRPRLRLPFEIDAIFWEDTGVEMPYTYEYADWLEGKCREIGIPFIIVDYDDPVVAPSKRYPLDEAYARQPKPGIPTRHPRSCTISKKVAPTSNLLNAHFDLRRGKWRQGDLLANVAPGTRHRIILGFAADEAQRAQEATGQCEELPYYVHDKRNWIEVYWPMIQKQMTREDAYNAVLAAGWPRPFKSGCAICPFAGAGHYWALTRMYPDLYARALALEQAATAHNPRLTLLDKPLEQAVDEWIKGHQPLPDPWDIFSEGFSQDQCWG